MTGPSAAQILEQLVADLKADPREQWCLGYDYGYRTGYDVGHAVAHRNIPAHLVEDAARALLARDAATFRASAVEGARAAHGDAWADAIAEQAGS